MDSLLNCFGYKYLSLTHNETWEGETYTHRHTTLFIGKVAAKVIAVSSLIFTLLQEIRSIK